MTADHNHITTTDHDKLHDALLGPYFDWDVGINTTPRREADEVIEAAAGAGITVSDDARDALIEYFRIVRDAESVINDQIHALSTEAGIAGDSAQVMICSIAVSSPDDGEDWIGPDGEPMTRTEARAECARVIATATAPRRAR